METSNYSSEQLRTLKKFGEELKMLRESKNLTQEALAYNAGFSRSYYTEVENGKRNISLLNIYKLADVLDVPFYEFLKHE